MQGTEDISVVIPGYGVCAHLGEVIAGIGRQQPAPREIIVVHSGDGDPSGDLPPAMNGVPVRVVHVDGRLFAGAARNRGAALAQSTWLAFVDSDVLPAGGWLAALAAASRDDPDACYIGAIDFARSGGYWGLCLWTIEFGSVHSYMPARIFENGPSANMFLSKQAFADAGGFPDAFQVAEDAMLQSRLRAAGLKIRFLPGARVGHYNIGGLRHTLRHIARLGVGGAEVRGRDAMRGSLAVRGPVLAVGLWLARFALIWLRTVRWAPRLVPRLLVLTPGILLCLWFWNAGFIKGALRQRAR